jgi:hypothetical protein
MSKDGNVDRLIREALAQDAAAGCPDAEVVASYVDGTLSRAERTTIDAHFARCARCRAQVALVVRAAADDADHEAVAYADPAERARPFVLRRWPWLASAAAATLAIAVWVAVEREPAPPSSQASAPQAAQDQKAPPRTEPAPANPEKLERFSEEKRRGDRQARSKAAPPRRPAESGRADRPARERAAAPAAAEAQDRVALLADAAALPGARSPDGRIWWRVTSAGTIERSADAGATWVAETGVSAPGARAMSAPASDVCWIVGQSGLVLVFRPGWSTATPPATVDLIAVSALGGSRATVTASDGRRFTTTDGGLTWRPVQEN